MLYEAFDTVPGAINYLTAVYIVIAFIFCRGKQFGHDVDLLLSHADQKVTDILLDTLVDQLKREVS